MISYSSEETKKRILSVLKGGDILFFVPPFVNARTPITGPHILQTIAREHGFEADILYVNLLLSSIIGNPLYESISFGKPFRMLGERLFARSAHGLPPLGKSPERCSNPVSSVFGSGRPYALEEFEYKYFGHADFDMDTFLDIETVCTALADDICDAIASLDYKIIGCSTNWEQNNCSVALINGIKKRRPGMLALIGGSNCEDEMAAGIASLSDAIDYVFSGESEQTFADFLKQFSRGELPAGRIVKAEPVENLEDIPLPDYTAFFDQTDCFFGDARPKEIVIGYETSRGCWWGKCDFCGQNGRRTRFRQKTARKAAKEMAAISARYPENRILLIDKLMPPKYQEELLPLLSEYQGSSPVSCEHRPNLSLREIIRLKESSFSVIKFGIEALSTGLLKLMNKGVTASQNILLLRNARSAGIFIDWNMLWGFPLDRAEFYEETLRLLPLIHHLTPPAVFRHLSLDRFCNYFEHPEKFQIENLRPWDVCSDVYPEWADLGRVAYRFTGDYPCGAHDRPEIIREISREIAVWREAWKQSNLVLISFGDYYTVYDTRKISNGRKPHVLDEDQAGEVMTCCAYTGSEYQQWAVENRLGAVIDSRYVPLVTGPPELLLRFETE